jgi:predicted metal-binding membrane protein
MRAPLDTRSGRDPAVVIWAAAGTCWAVTAALVLAGASGFCHDGVAPDGTSGPPGTVFAVWFVMIGAMMLPTTVPLARMFVVVTARAPRSTGTRVAFLAGYLALWSGFAAVALLGDRAVDALLGRAAPSGLVLGAVLVVAGVFQLTPWKNHCLTVCRSPWMFLWQYYGRGVRGAWMLGVRHGAFCLGCCWALMLVMLGTGVSSIRWMLALTGAMLLEKTAPKGSRLAVPLGGALILAGAAVFLPAVGAFPADLAGSAARPGGDGAAGKVALVVAAVSLAMLWPAQALARQRRAGRTGSRRDHRPARTSSFSVTGCGGASTATATQARTSCASASPDEPGRIG